MKWTEEKIEAEIKFYVARHEMKRMPTVSELQGNMRGDLANAISKNGGFAQWAQRLHLNVKSSETSLGKSFEEHFRNALQQIQSL